MGPTMKDPTKQLKVGESITVKVTEVDDQGRLVLAKVL